MSESRPSAVEAARPSFRRRLLTTLGAALGAALFVLGLVVWISLYVWLTVQAHAALDREARFVASLVVTPRGVLDPDAYAWSEPHHRFAGPHLDAYFLQVFGPDRRLLRQSDNITFFAEAAYPGRLLAVEPETRAPLPGLRTFAVDGERFYHLTRELRGRRGERLGYVQVARAYPPIGRDLRRAALLLAAGFLVTLAGLMLIVRWQAARVLRPLRTITAAARRISAHRLSERVPVPPGADRETAHLAATLNDQLARLEQAFDEMYRFTAHAAHELQTPLTVLRGHVEVALRRPRPAEAYRETLGLVGGEIDGLTRMVHGLLVLARLDREGGRLPVEPVDLVRLARLELDACAEALDAKRLSASLDAPPAAPVRGQPGLLREVIANLLDNAIKFTRAGGVSVEIEAGAEEVRLSVRDTGVGMRPDEAARATERFFRAASASRLEIPGSGLGLALVSQIVARHGGRFRIDSAPGSGTSCTLWLPAAPAEAETPPAGPVLQAEEEGS